MNTLEAAIVRAFTREVARLKRTVGAWEHPDFDIVGAGASFQGDEAFAGMTAALTAALLAKGRAAVATARAQVDALAKVSVDELMIEWAQFNAGELVSGAGRAQKEAIREVITAGIRTNQTVPQIARELRTVIGVSPRDARALRKMRDALIREGATNTVVAKRVKRRADIMVKRRAITIARTELSAAVTQGQLAEWGIAASEGRLEPTMHRKWIARDPCKVCRALARHRAVPLSQPFVDINGRALYGPPAHPRCKCSVRLVPAPRR